MIRMKMAVRIKMICGETLEGDITMFKIDEMTMMASESDQHHLDKSRHAAIDRVLNGNIIQPRAQAGCKGFVFHFHDGFLQIRFVQK